MVNYTTVSHVVSKVAQPVTVAYLIAEHIRTGSWSLDYCTSRPQSITSYN